MTGLGCFVRPSIGEALAFGALQYLGGAFRIFDAERRSAVPAKSKFVDVALQVLLADRVERAGDAALQYREEALDRLGVRVAANVFAKGMGNGLMVGEILAD